jgi:DNA-binding response OmpR family regulator
MSELGEVISLSRYRRQRDARTQCIVVADADAAAGAVVADMLVSLGYRVSLCRTALEAFDAALSQHADAVISELGLYLPDGTPLVSALRAAEPSLPLGVLTGWLDHPDCYNGALQDVPLVLAKPLRLGDLALMANLLCGGVELARALP